jgi:hypothetical protein
MSRIKTPALFLFYYIGSPKKRSRPASNSKIPGAGIGYKAAAKFQFAYKRFRGRGLLTHDHYHTLIIGVLSMVADAKLHL